MVEQYYRLSNQIKQQGKLKNPQEFSTTLG